MAISKKELEAIYKNEIADLTKNSQKWQSLLHNFGNNFKCSFDTQVLINAQSEKNVALLTYNGWSNHYNRGVKKGINGIGVLDPSVHLGVNYYFDISDTYEENPSKAIVPLWEVKAKHHSNIINSLKSTYNVTDEKSHFPNIINKVIENILEKNNEIYFSNLTKNLKNSILGMEDLADLNNIYCQTIKSSVKEVVLNRCNIYSEIDDFKYLNLFDTPATVQCLGNATQDISQVVLNNISKITLHLQSAKESNNILEEVLRNEKQLHGNRRSILSPGESESTNGSIRLDEGQISERGKERSVSDLGTDGAIKSTPRGRAGGSHGTVGNLDDADAESRGSNRSTKSTGSNEMGRDDEQYQEQSRGNNTGRADLRLNESEQLPQFNNQAAEDQKSSAFTFSQEKKDNHPEIIGNIPFKYIKAKKYRKLETALSKK